MNIESNKTPFEPLTKEQLLQALIKIQSAGSNIDWLLSWGALEDYAFWKLSPTDAAKKCAEVLYSDELLEYLNKHMAPVYAVDAETPCGRVSEFEMFEELLAWNDIEGLLRLWQKPAVCVGHFTERTWGQEGYSSFCNLCTYIDIDGSVFTVKCCSIVLNDRTVPLEVREVIDRDDHLSLNRVEDMFSESFKGFWND